jgi:hypothetical protein
MLELFFAKRWKVVLTRSIMNPHPHNVWQLLSCHCGPYVKVSKEFRALLTQQWQDKHSSEDAKVQAVLRYLEDKATELVRIFRKPWHHFLEWFPWAQNFNGRSKRKPVHGQHGSTSRAFSAIPVSIRVFSIHTLLMVILSRAAYSVRLTTQTSRRVTYIYQRHLAVPDSPFSFFIPT